MSPSDYYAEFMKQTFNDSFGKNYTPLAIMFYLREKSYIIEKESVYNLCKYVYRFFRDNENFSKENSNVIISNLSHYYIEDIKQYMYEQLNIWMKNGNGVLLFDGNTIFTAECLNLTKKEISSLNKIIDSLMLRNFKTIIKYTPIYDIQKEVGQIANITFDDYCDILNKSKFINRAFENMNYCACCEETNKSLLQPINLKINSDINDPDNSIVMCKKHALMYFNGLFKFNKYGKIIINQANEDLDKRMHINTTLVSKKKKYLGGDDDDE